MPSQTTRRGGSFHANDKPPSLPAIYLNRDCGTTFKSPGSSLR